jgi:hypothetical protein
MRANKNKWKFFWKSPFNLQASIFRASHLTHTALSQVTFGEASRIKVKQPHLYNKNSSNALGVYHFRILVFEQVTKNEPQWLVQHWRDRQSFK